MSTLHGYRLFSENICDEYAAETMFFRSQAFPTEKKPEKARFCLAFFDLQKKPKVFKISQNFKIWLQKSQIGTPVLNHYNQALQQEQCTFVKQIMTT